MNFCFCYRILSLRSLRVIPVCIYIKMALTPGSGFTNSPNTWRAHQVDWEHSVVSGCECCLSLYISPAMNCLPTWMWQDVACQAWPVAAMSAWLQSCRSFFLHSKLTTASHSVEVMEDRVHGSSRKIRITWCDDFTWEQDWSLSLFLISKSHSPSISPTLTHTDTHTMKKWYLVVLQIQDVEAGQTLKAGHFGDSEKNYITGVK